MEIRESFTVTEIEEILNSLDIETEVEPYDAELMCLVVACESGDLTFNCILEYQEPFFEMVGFIATRESLDNPSAFVNEFNQNHRFSSAHSIYDSEFDDDDDGFYSTLKSWIPFAGGIAVEHLTILIELWIDDLCEFMEINPLSDEESLDFPEMTPSVAELDVAAQIAWALGDHISRTARELAEFLMLDKHTVNSALYKNSDLFVREGGQPPRWNRKVQV